MKCFPVTGLILIAVFSAITGHAQPKGAPKNGSDPGKGKKVFMPQVFLGKTDFSGGPMKKDDFTHYLRQGLSSRDSLGNRYRVTGFDFIYGERNLYEDSSGTLQVMVDYNTEHCFGDTLLHDMTVTIPAERSRTGEETPGIYDRIKPGDTIYFDHIAIERMARNSVMSIPDTLPIAGRGMKFWIIR